MKPLALVIENDGGTRRLLDVLLTRSGLDVDLVATGTDALLLLEHVRYDVLFIDLLLPGATGMQVLERLAEAQPYALARSVVLSSAPEWQLQRVRDRWPQVRVIRKPFELGEIAESAAQIAASRDERAFSLGEVFCRHSVRAGARSGLIVRETGGNLELVSSFGYPAATIEAYFPIDLEAAMPICAAVRTATPVWLASVAVAKAEYPQLASTLDTHQSRALAAVPLLPGGRAAGAVGWSFREPRLFAEEERQNLMTIAAALAGEFPDGAKQSTTAAEA